MDSDADTVTGMSQCVTLMSGETNRTVDAGLFSLPCQLLVTKTACVLDVPGAGSNCVTTFSGPDCVQVKYTYIIQNTGGGPANNVSVMDDRLGQVPGSPIALIPGGGTVILMATNTVCCTVTNTVTVMSGDGQCRASASASVGKCNPVTACTPPYPFVSANPRTSIDFNESEVLRGVTVSVADGCLPQQIRVFYNDEHALTLGVRRVIVKTAGGTTTTDYPIAPLTQNPGSVLNPSVGSTALSGDQAGTDESDRPLYPALFLTDITSDPTSLAGDWQFGGTAIPPHAVFGTWKGAVRTVDRTRNPANVTVTPDADPAKNNWNLDGGDVAPPGLVNQGYGAEVRWEVSQLGLLPGHTYRMYFMVHDGDQNKTGGDVGQGCAILGVGAQINCPPPPCPSCVLGYPFASANPRTSIEFNESEVLRAFSTNVAGPGDTIKVWYNDEHALTLGIRQVIVKTAGGTTTTDYPLTLLGSNPGSALFPQVGTTALTGDQAGTDPFERPMYPALFLTDITLDAGSRAGDWQFGGTAIPPHAVIGTWKGAVRIVDATRSPVQVTVTPDADPAKNSWNLDGGDAAPPGLVNQGYGAEVRWNVNDLGLIPGHTYRLQFMVHDGDQNRTGGDTGQGCTVLCFRDGPPSAAGALGDFVWNDLNGNGVQDSGEPGVPNVTVQLLNCSGTMLAQTTTDAGGLYLFANLSPGGYRVRFVPPVGYGFTTPNAGLDDARDSDANAATGVSDCATVLAGQTNRTVDAGVFRQSPPGLLLIKSASPSFILPNGTVTYSYTVTNSGVLTLNNVVVTDDNGTPGFALDDIIVGTVPVLPPNGSATFSRTLILPVTLCDSGTSLPSGMIVSEVLSNGNYRVSFIQARDVNDNTYGVNAIGWAKKGHKFSDLTGSDHVSWEFRNGLGQVVLAFDQDYISAASTALFPSGFGCLGFGGDGRLPTVGNAAHVLDFSASLEANLNRQPFLGALAQYIVNSPALTDPNAPFWEYRMIYTVVLDKAAFGASGLGLTAIVDQHNSPGKRSVVNPQPCQACVTNIATGTATAGGLTLTASASASVCIDLSLPRLSATVSGHILNLAWENPSTGYQLQCSGTCSPVGTWTDVPNVPVVINGQKTVQVPMTGQLQFYRLRKP